MRILALDQQGQPDCWVSIKESITYHAKNMVVWQLGVGEGDVTLYGGENRISGLQSRITTAPIIAVKNESGRFKRLDRIPALTNRDLFRRDRHLCAYCVRVFADLNLTRDHIIPVSKGGKDHWTNVVTACESCNHKKADKPLESCGLELHYIPYAPNRAEALILDNRAIIACQMSYLMPFVNENSRLKNH